MPIADISGLSAKDAGAKVRIRERIQEFYHQRLDIPLTTTTVTFLDDKTAGEGPSARVIARLYSMRFMTMKERELNENVDTIVLILQEEAGHDINEAFVIPVLALRCRTKSCQTEA